MDAITLKRNPKSPTGWAMQWHGEAAAAFQQTLGSDTLAVIAPNPAFNDWVKHATGPQLLKGMQDHYVKEFKGLTIILEQ